MSTIANIRTAPHRIADAALVAALLLLGWQLAYWTWHFMTPAAQPVPITAASGDAWERARTLFGDAGPATAVAPASSIRLKGVYAADGKTLSVAVVNTGGKGDRAVKVGEEVEKGATLAAVHADYIELSRAGVRERIDMERRVATAPAGRPGAPAPTRGFKLNVAQGSNNTYSLSRSELNTTLQDPGQLQFTGRIGTHPQGGVRMDSAPPGSLPAKLGFQPGDVIKSINGQVVNSPGDLARLYGQFGSLSSLRAEVLRGGSPMVINFQIQP